MSSLTFTLGLTITVTADNISLDNYIAPTIRAGVLLETSISIDKVKNTFVYLTNEPNVPLLDSFTTVQYACLKQNNGTLEVPNYSFENIIPNTLTVGTTLPTASGYTLSDYTTSTSINKTVEFDLLQFIAVHLLHTDSDISSAIASVTKTLPNTTTISDPVLGIINNSDFRENLLNNISNGFAAKLATFNVNADGEGSPYSATAPTDQVVDFAPSLEITRAIFNNQPNRLSSVGLAIPNASVLGVKSELTAIGVPIEVGDFLDFNIIVVTNQKSKSESNIDSRTYRLRSQVVA